MFASDRDLLVLDPNLFRDVGWVGQRLLRATGSVSGSTLTISAYDVSFADAGVGPGHIITVDGVTYEVIERLSATQATVSRLRASAADPVLPPSPASGKDTWVVTFTPQVAAVHEQVIRLLGIEPQDPPDLAGVTADPGGVTEASITNPGALARLEALGTLAIVWGAASALQGPRSPAGERAEWYRARFARERETVSVRLDLDGDGRPDATRHLGNAPMRRA